MTNEQKKQIAVQLKGLIDSGISGNKLSRRIGNISSATISQMINLKWLDGDHSISNEMWNVTAAYLGIGNDWVIVDTLQNYKRVYRIAKDCQTLSLARAIAALPGTGKSTALKSYASASDEVYYIECKEHWNRKVFLNKIRQAMGLSVANESVSDIAEQISDFIKKCSKPLIILDEADKLKDTVINFFVSLYNDTNKRCGYVLSGSIHFQKTVEKYVSKNKMGYAEFYSRMGRDFIQLRAINAEDIRALCSANGASDEDFIKSVISEVINNGHNDLRRAERMVMDFKKSRK